MIFNSIVQKIRKNTVFRNIGIFFTGSILVSGISSITQLIYPKVLTIEDYGMFKEFTLYLSYSSLFHFGLKDGIYLWLCEKPLTGYSRNSFLFSVFVVQQFLVSVIIIALGLIFREHIFFMLSLGIGSFFSIIISYFDSVFYSKNEFGKVIKLRFLRELILLFVLVVIFIVFKELYYKLLIVIFISLTLLITILYYSEIKSKLTFYCTNIKNILRIKSIYLRGSKILVANFGQQFSINIDKLFVSIFYSTKEFGIYAFGGVFFILVNVLVNSISTVLLPYLSSKSNSNQKNYLVMIRNFAFISIFFLPFYIALFLLIKYYYSEYISSIKVIALLSFASVFNVQTTVIQINFLKVLKYDKSYIRSSFLGLLIIIITLIVFKLLDISFFYVPLSLALGTLFKYIYNDILIFKEYKLNYARIDLVRFAILIVLPISILAVSTIFYD